MMIYQKSTHSIQNSERYEGETFSWLICNTLEIIVDFSTGEMLNVEGYFPLTKAKERRIIIPDTAKSAFYFSEEIRKGVRKNAIYILERKFPMYRKIFSTDNLFFDKENGIIQNGINGDTCNYYSITANVCIATTAKNELCCLYIKPDIFVD